MGPRLLIVDDEPDMLDFLDRVFRREYEVIRALSVDEAVTEARIAISVAAASTVEWGSPVLYMQTADGALFQVTPQIEELPPGPGVADCIGVPFAAFWLAGGDGEGEL